MKLPILFTFLFCLLGQSQATEEESYNCTRYESKFTVYCHVKLGSLDLVIPQIAKDVKTFIFNDTIGYHHLIPYGKKFQNLPLLEELRFSHVRMTMIPPNYFSDLNKLERLTLTHNEIQDFLHESWSGLANLKVLDLSHNWIRSDKLADSVFGQMSNLQILDLSYNKLEHLEAKVFRNLTNLQVLNLTHNHLSTFDESSIKTKMDKLHDLQISQNNLKQLESVLLDKMPNLHTLNASHNHLSVIGANDFKNLTKIRSIDLACNEIDSLADGTFQSMKLEYLDLSNNTLSTISRNAFEDAEIKVLKLANNNINVEQLTIALQQAAKIESLDLSNLGFDDNTWFNDLIASKNESLIKLNMSHNKFTRLPRLPMMSRIKEIDLSYNEIRVLNPLADIAPEIAHQVDTKQTFLYLHGNPFTCLPCNMFSLIQIAKSWNAFKCAQDTSYCLSCYLPDGSAKMIYEHTLPPNDTETDYSTCQMRALSYTVSKPSYETFLIILWLIIVLVLISIFGFLILIFRQRIYSAVYYTRNQTTDQSNGVHKRKLNALSLRPATFKTESLRKFMGFGVQAQQNGKSTTNDQWLTPDPTHPLDSFQNKSTISVEQKPYAQNGENGNNNLANKRSSVSLLIDSIERKQNSTNDLKSDYLTTTQTSNNHKATTFSQPLLKPVNQQVRFEDAKDETTILLSD